MKSVLMITPIALYSLTLLPVHHSKKRPQRPIPMTLHQYKLYQEEQEKEKITSTLIQISQLAPSLGLAAQPYQMISNAYSKLAQYGTATSKQQKNWHKLSETYNACAQALAAVEIARNNISGQLLNPEKLPAVRHCRDLWNEARELFSRNSRQYIQLDERVRQWNIFVQRLNITSCLHDLLTTGRTANERFNSFMLNYHTDIFSTTLDTPAHILIPFMKREIELLKETYADEAIFRARHHTAQAQIAFLERKEALLQKIAALEKETPSTSSIATLEQLIESYTTLFEHCSTAQQKDEQALQEYKQKIVGYTTQKNTWLSEQQQVLTARIIQNEQNVRPAYDVLEKQYRALAVLSEKLNQKQEQLNATQKCTLNALLHQVSQPVQLDDLQAVSQRYACYEALCATAEQLQLPTDTQETYVLARKLYFARKTLLEHQHHIKKRTSEELLSLCTMLLATSPIATEREKAEKIISLLTPNKTADTKPQALS